MLLSSPRVALTAGSDAVTCEVLTAGSLDGLAAASPAFSASVAADTPLALPVRARGTAVGLRITGSGKWALEAAEASVVG
jgi:aspartate aminotransferase-like enzyme